MRDSYVVVTGSMSDGTVYAHVMKTFVKDGYHCASLLDMEMPDVDIIRNIGFNDSDTVIVRDAVKGAGAEVTRLSRTGDALLFYSISDLKRGLGDSP